MHNQTSKKIKLAFSYPMLALLPFFLSVPLGDRDEASDDPYLSVSSNLSNPPRNTCAKIWGLERKAIMEELRKAPYHSSHTYLYPGLPAKDTFQKPGLIISSSETMIFFSQKKKKTKFFMKSY